MNSKQRSAVLAGAAVVVISCALLLTSQRNKTGANPDKLLLPALAAELNTVSQLRVRKGAAIVTVHKQGEGWTVVERGDYPANVAKIRTMLLGLSESKIIEAKTTDPAKFSVIGVEDPDKSGAGGAQIEVTAQDGAHAVIVGKAVGEGNFARRGGESQTYIVEPGITVDADAHGWIDAKLIDVPVADIQSIAITQPAGTNYSLHRAAPADKSEKDKPAAPPAAMPFVLDTVPAGRTAADPQILAPSPTAFGNVSAEDVGAMTDLDFSKPTLATVTLQGGKVITFTGVVIGDKHWLVLAAPSDAAVTAKTSGRAFEIAGYRYDGIFRPLEQLLVPKPPPPDKKPPSEKKKGLASPAS